MTHTTNSNPSIHIYPFMRRLGIKGNTLMLYALLYSFSNGRIGLYYGSRNRLADYLDVSVRTVYRGLGILRNADLIENAFSEDGRYGIRCSPVKDTDTEKEADKKENGSSVSDTYVAKMLSRHTNTSESYQNMLRMQYKYEAPSVKGPTFLSFGRRGYIMMTEPQYRELTKLLPTHELMPYFEKVELMVEAALKNPTVRKSPHNHYKTIRKWIEEDLAL